MTNSVKENNSILLSILFTTTITTLIPLSHGVCAKHLIIM